ncbi:conserved hypothetical protein [Neospora caninum Liverpool]|uniref:Uncharacterized protein n=1 Tax=Neospora caninum (strain Liverpool) TaxID=572307 RepID=F0VKZ2_NEOCL|nr:conserved hypothetical protein [Neospora caninum Liverpool]CBZ54744.1 conserved hypothetical protein [Neospora caninum Liverpool]CEL69459.1 TPA: hypothetical protein BN1204_051700 [Neospora caninum Liverpool]|eukprot:XP_003884772.1 conserved hypothetical protein [Neospora caninum Liverpool]
MPDSCRKGTNGAENTRPRSTRVRSLGHRLNRQSAANLADLFNVTDVLVKHAARNPFVPWKVWKRGGGTYLPCPAATPPKCSDSAASLRSIKASRTPVRRLRRLAREKGGSGSFTKPSSASPVVLAASPLFHAAASSSPSLQNGHLSSCKYDGSVSSQGEVYRADDGFPTLAEDQVNGTRPHPPVPPWLSLSSGPTKGVSVYTGDYGRYCYPLSRPESEDPPPLPPLSECFLGFERGPSFGFLPRWSAGVSKADAPQSSCIPERSYEGRRHLMIAGLRDEAGEEACRNWTKVGETEEAVLADWNTLTSDGERRRPFFVTLRSMRHSYGWEEDGRVSPFSAGPSPTSQDRLGSDVASAASYDGSFPTDEGIGTVERSEKLASVPSTASTVSSMKKGRAEEYGHLRSSESPSVDSSSVDGLL